MNALSINIPANFIASCESTLKRYVALLAEGVDRNSRFPGWAMNFLSRPPRGGRG